MNRDCYRQNEMEKAPVVSGRRGRNFLLHNLEESDVVFGTKGNGRNEIFLKVLENYSEQYVQLSKFQKMGLIQKIIRDWKGNFYIMSSKTNDLHLAKKKDHDLSTTDPSSRKLYTSVRRMMNYVNSKIQRQPYQPLRSEINGTSVLIPKTSSVGQVVSTPRNPKSNLIQTKKENEQEPRNITSVFRAKIVNLASQENHPTTATDYIRKNHVTLPLPENKFLNFHGPLSVMSISSSSERSTMLVTPEPSPRAMLLSPPPFSPIQFSEPALSQNNTPFIVPSSPITPLPLETVTRKNYTKSFYSKQERTITTLTAKKKKIKKNLHTADNNIGDLEESAILALTSLGSSSCIMSS